MQDEADTRIAGSDRPTSPAVDRQALVEEPFGPGPGSESLMSIPTTAPVQPVNRSANRGPSWLFLGLVSAVVMTCAGWEHVKRSTSLLAGLTGVGGPSARAADSLLSVGRTTQELRRSDLGVADAVLMYDQATAGSIESLVALRSAAGALAGTDSHETERLAPIARALASIKECQIRYQNIRDYTCTFSKRERIKGQLTPLNVLMMKARTQPKSIYLKFRQPSAGREAIYVVGRNDGRVVVHDVGLNKLLAGTLRLEPTGGRAMEGCRHRITPSATCV
jgi:hypothetical protein